MYEAMEDEEVGAYSIQGKRNPSDAFTKYVDYNVFMMAMYYIMRHAHFKLPTASTARPQPSA